MDGGGSKEQRNLSCCRLVATRGEEHNGSSVMRNLKDTSSNAQSAQGVAHVTQGFCSVSRSRICPRGFVLEGWQEGGKAKTGELPISFGPATTVFAFC